MLDSVCTCYWVFLKKLKLVRYLIKVLIIVQTKVFFMSHHNRFAPANRFSTINDDRVPRSITGRFPYRQWVNSNHPRKENRRNHDLRETLQPRHRKQHRQPNACPPQQQQRQQHQPAQDEKKALARKFQSLCFNFLLEFFITVRLVVREKSDLSTAHEEALLRPFEKLVPRCLRDDKEAKKQFLILTSNIRKSLRSQGIEWRLRSLQNAYMACSQAATSVDPALFDEYTARAFNAASKSNSALQPIRRARDVHWNRDKSATAFFITLSDNIPFSENLSENVEKAWSNFCQALREEQLCNPNNNPNSLIPQLQAAPRATSPVLTEAENASTNELLQFAMDVSANNNQPVSSSSPVPTVNDNQAISEEPASNSSPQPTNGILQFALDLSARNNQPTATSSPLPTDNDHQVVTEEPAVTAIPSAPDNQQSTAAEEPLNLSKRRTPSPVQPTEDSHEIRGAGTKRASQPFRISPESLPAQKKQGISSSVFYGPGPSSRPSTSAFPQSNFNFQASSYANLANHAFEAQEFYEQAEDAVSNFFGTPPQPPPSPARTTAPGGVAWKVPNNPPLTWKDRTIKNKCAALAKGREWWNNECKKDENILIWSRGPSQWTCRRCKNYTTNSITKALNHVIEKHPDVSEHNRKTEQRFRDAARGWKAP